MLSFIFRLIPQDYKWSVGIKKVAWTLAKTGIALIAGTRIGKEVKPEDWQIVSEVSAALIAGGMKFFHDWAKMRWPGVKWL